jgi:hypothetical protein
VNNVGFLITAYDQKREVRFTVDMLRKKWNRTSKSPISIVISGDPDRTVKFPDDPLTRVTTLDDMVGKDFNGLVSTSIMKQIRHGIIELRDLERVGDKVDFVVHMHGDILLLNEEGFFAELERFNQSGKSLAVDTVGAQKTDYIHFDGYEIMPQLFAVRKHFLDNTGYFDRLSIHGDLEKRSTEWALKGNLARAIKRSRAGCDWYEDNFFVQNYCHIVAAARSQWDLHRHWGGFAHFGNSLHFPQHVREARNKMALQAYGVDLSAW